MSVVENLPIAYHQQNRFNYCGAACAQMVLNLIGAGLINQRTLYRSIRSKSRIQKSKWWSGPDGLTKIMNNKRPAGFVNNFELFEENHADKISRKIVWTIHRYKVAPIALVYGLDHWVTIKGFDCTANPRSSTDLSFGINAFWINNPWPPAENRNARSSTFSHKNHDRCGSGGKYGIENEHIPYEAWVRDYMTGVPTGHWQGKYLAICDPEPAPKRVGKRQLVQTYFDGSEFISNEVAGRFAVKGLQDFGLYNKGFLHTNPEELVLGEPTLVKRLDRTNDWYYLVPIEDKAKNIRALVSVDGRFANYRQAIFAKDIENPIAFRPLPEEEIVRRISREKQSRIRKIQSGLSSRDLNVSNSLVWRPCMESLSPYWPFHMVRIGKNEVFVRIDGRMCTNLTTDFGSLRNKKQ